MKQNARIFLVMILFGAGFAHFIFPEEFVRSIPSNIPNPDLMVLLTGLLEIIAIPGLLYRKSRLFTSYILIFYFMALLPAHFEMVISGASIFGISDKSFFILRIFLQIIPIMLAWYGRESVDRSFLPFLQKFDDLIVQRWTQNNAWHSKFLLAAAFYNVGWGAWVVIYPEQSFLLFDLTPPTPIFVWQSVGMIVGVFGIGYAMAAIDEDRHYPIVLVGMLGKFFGPVGFVYNYLSGNVPLAFGTLLLFNDLIWWPSFLSILLTKWKKFKNS